MHAGKASLQVLWNPQQMLQTQGSFSKATSGNGRSRCNKGSCCTLVSLLSMCRSSPYEQRMASLQQFVNHSCCLLDVETLKGVFKFNKKRYMLIYEFQRSCIRTLLHLNRARLAFSLFLFFLLSYISQLMAVALYLAYRHESGINRLIKLRVWKQKSIFPKRSNSNFKLILGDSCLSFLTVAVTLVLLVSRSNVYQWWSPLAWTHNWHVWHNCAEGFNTQQRL